MPANPSSTPAKNTTLFKLPKFGVSFPALKGIAICRPANSQYAPSAISTNAGTRVPAITPGLLRRAVHFMPKKLARVSPQKIVSIAITR
jgi:hypothetical protein